MWSGSSKISFIYIVYPGAKGQQVSEPGALFQKDAKDGVGKRTAGFICNYLLLLQCYNLEDFFVNINVKQIQNDNVNYLLIITKLNQIRSFNVKQFADIS
jgi:hypothetical protein